MSPEDSDHIVPLLAVFCSLFSLLIATLHDSEFYADDNHTGVYSFREGWFSCTSGTEIFMLKHDCWQVVTLKRWLYSGL